MRKLPITLRPLDYAALAVCIAVVVVVSLLVIGDGGAPSEVTLEADSGTFLYPLDVDRTLALEGPIGFTTIEVSDGRVRFVDSPCRDKICIAAGWFGRSGQWAACLPNRVFARVEGAQSEDDVDAQTY